MPTDENAAEFATIQPLPRRNGKAAMKITVGKCSIIVASATLAKLVNHAKDSQSSDFSLRVEALAEEPQAAQPAPAAPTDGNPPA